MICVGCREPHRAGDCEDARRHGGALRSCCCQHKPYATAQGEQHTELSTNEEPEPPGSVPDDAS
ncbi:hypothetical protein ATK17_3799 [Branchiibius hedensis]|uniref:Uncharacterized protein n=1 Tax=Branchiibius hedensis TaxID=672460 RepID=A0A2Y9BN79_9MICO|nr:hypothetical protein ATK17_3799 [Branchiibius hedensis]SSA58994.1 hypothetical protein SAMN04489750_3799 [Branchiibius hedensis]